MTLNDLKNYLNNSPFSNDLPNDTQLTKYMNYAMLILKAFFVIDDDFFNTEDGVTVVGEEVNYLLENNPHEDILKMYNYLKKFSVGGAITGEVAETLISFICPFVKNLMKAYGIDPIQSDTGKSYYNYSIF